jgi:hypothetical protein
MMSFVLNLFLFLLGLGIGIKYERWTRDRVSGGHSKFQETGFTESRYHSKQSGFKASTNARSSSGKKNSRFHIS